MLLATIKYVMPYVQEIINVCSHSQTLQEMNPNFSLKSLHFFISIPNTFIYTMIWDIKAIVITKIHTPLMQIFAYFGQVLGASSNKVEIPGFRVYYILSVIRFGINYKNILIAHRMTVWSRCPQNVNQRNRWLAAMVLMSPSPSERTYFMDHFYKKSHYVMLDSQKWKLS